MIQLVNYLSTAGTGANNAHISDEVLVLEAW